MAPTNPSRKTREEFVQWKEPARVLGNDEHVTGVASPSGARKKKQARRVKVVVEAAEDSRTGSESTSAPVNAVECESGRHIEPAVHDMSNRAPITPKSAASQRFVAPRPTTAPTSKGIQRVPSEAAVHHSRHPSMSPQGRHNQRVETEAEENMDAEGDCDFQNTPVQRCAARPPGMAVF